MIRINLLSTGPKGRPAKPQYDVRAQLLLGVGLLVITLSACWWYSVSLDDEIAARQTEKADKEKQVTQLKEQVKQVSEFEARKKQLEDKNRIIDQLEKSRVGPVKVMDHVSQSLESLKIWLVRVGVTGEVLNVPARSFWSAQRYPTLQGIFHDLVYSDANHAE